MHDFDPTDPRPHRAAFDDGRFCLGELSRPYRPAESIHVDFISVNGPGGHVAGFERREDGAWERMFCERHIDEDGEPTGHYEQRGLVTACLEVIKAQHP